MREYYANMKYAWNLGVASLVVALTSCNGQILNFQMRQGQPFPWNSTQYPEDQTVQVEGSGAWVAKISGPMATGCYTWKAACFTVKPRTGGVPGEAVVSFQASGSETLLSGVHDGEIQIGTQRWVVRLTVLPRRPYLPFYYRQDYPRGCYNSDPQMPHADTCAITNEAPAQNFAALRDAGSQYLDPQFGSPVHRVSPSGFNVSYSSMGAFSATGKYMLTVDTEGFVQIWNRQAKTKAGERLNVFNIGQAVWDPDIDEKIWYFEGARVGYRNIRTGQNTIVANYGSSRGGRPAFEKLDTGGTADNTDDNWWVFVEEKQKQVCAIDLNGLAPNNQEDHLYCMGYARLGIQILDFPQVTQVDAISKKRYVLILAAPRAQVLSVNAASHSLTLEYQMPGGLSTPHSDVGQDSSGQQVFFWTWYDPHGDKNYIATAALNKNELMLRPVEEGGGLKLIYPLFTGGQITDTHFGCNWRGYCVASFYRELSPETKGIPSLAINEVRSGAPCVVRTAVNHGFRTGQSVAIGGGGGVTNLNGVKPVQVVDARTLSLTGACTGNYGAQKAYVAEAKQWSADSPNRDEVVVIRLDGEVRRVAMHRSKRWADQGDINAYWSSPRASISRDGAFVAFSSNLGLPEPNSVFWAEVDQTGEVKNAKVESLDRQALLSWEGSEAVAVLVSSRYDMEDLVFSYRHFLGETMQRWIDGLMPDSDYFFQIVGDNGAWFGSFRTLDTPLGTVQRISKAQGN